MFGLKDSTVWLFHNIRNVNEGFLLFEMERMKIPRGPSEDF